MIFNKYAVLICFLMGFISCWKTGDERPPIQINDPLIAIAFDSLMLIPEKGLVYHLGKPFTGKAVTYFENRHQASHIDYVEGKKEGYYRKWFPNGRLSFESEYLDGKKNGISKTWWKNGQIRSESNFEEGIAHGLQTQWYKSGAKFKQRNLVNGREEEIQRSWRENGKLYNNYEAKAGRIFGLKRATLCFELEEEQIK